MKNLKEIAKKILFINFIILIGVLLSCRVFGYYTDSISKGDNLKFIGNSWYVYNSENAAKNLDKSAIKKTINKNTVFGVYAKSGNVLKISNSNEYIYYGSTGSKNFTKVLSEANNKDKLLSDELINSLFNITTKNTSNSLGTNLFESLFDIAKRGIEGTLKIGLNIFKGLFSITSNTAETAVSEKSNNQKVDNTDKVEVVEKIEDSSIFSNQGSKNKLWAYRSAVTNKKSHQYALLNGLKYNDIDYSKRVSVDKETNIVMIDNTYYCTALGTYFGNVGDKFIVKLDTNKTIYVIMCDAKGTAAQYKKDGKTLAHDYNGTKSFLEFYCNGYPKKEGLNYVYQEKFEGKVTSITKIY